MYACVCYGRGLIVCWWGKGVCICAVCCMFRWIDHDKIPFPSLTNHPNQSTHTQGHEEAADVLFKGLPEEFQMWMSHGDKLHSLPEG